MTKKVEETDEEADSVPLFADRFKLIELGDAAVQAYNDMTPKMRAIVIAYMETGKNWMAYKRATGYTGPNETAGTMARRILKDKRCEAVISAWRKQALENLDVTPGKILAGLARIAFGDIRGFFNEADGTMKPISELPRTQADMIASFEVEELYAGSGNERTSIGVVKKVKIIDRKSALDSLARTEGMFLTERKAKETGVKYVAAPPVASIEDWKAKNAR
jgi:phage terminase small subunit